MTWIMQRLNGLLMDALGLAGAAALIFGVWQLNRPAGWIVGGALGILAAILAARNAPREN